uniref:Uncharacterized protein n=1 Tax=Ditylum brightwellii TaxID=49249 RepID=A0A7S4W5V4_9STRA
MPKTRYSTQRATSSMSASKKQKTTPSLYELLCVRSKYEVDEAAVIQAAQQKLDDDDRICPYWYHSRIKSSFLSRALELGLGIDVIKALISPVAIRQKDLDNGTALHRACQGEASSEVLTTVLDAWPDAAKHLDNDRKAPLHYLCQNRYASFETLTVVFDASPDAVFVNNYYSRTPFYWICQNRYASMDMVHKVLDQWLILEHNRSSHAVDSFISEVENQSQEDLRGDIKEPLHYLSSLFKGNNNQNYPYLNDMMTYFINANLWNGVWLVIKTHPSIVKTMELQTTIKADFLFTAKEYLYLPTMMILIKK